MSEKQVVYDNGPGRILSNRLVAPDHFLMELEAPFDPAGVCPGQFVMLRVGDGISPILRRPFGICSMNEDRGSFSVLYRVVGLGTRVLSEMMEGTSVDVLGPLGQGFRMDEAGQRPLLVAGGVGVPPLYMLASAMVKKGMMPDLVIGGRGSKELLLVNEFEALDLKVFPATEDGSKGFKGYVTGIMEEMFTREDTPTAIYSCGPEPMLKRVGEMAIERGIPCQLSLEAVMACGFGVCLGCVIRTCSEERPEMMGYSRVCAEGPVFDARKVIWE